MALCNENTLTKDAFQVILDRWETKSLRYNMNAHSLPRDIEHTGLTYMH